MALGPILIFDKSTLQSLNPDEALWLDNFFLTNITPLFFIETLADLEKEVHSGRTPEEVVGNLAYKTPDMQSRPNVHHATLLAGELSGAGEIDMRYGRPIISGGEPRVLEGKTGILFQQAPEQEAFHRWQRGDFLDLERLTAKAWRRALSNVRYDELYTQFQAWFAGRAKPRTLLDAKSFADAIIDGPKQEETFQFGLALVGVPGHSQEQVLARWRSAGKPPIREFAPYFRYVFSVDLFFYLAIAADLISRVRPSNKVDLAYLYYLPFCMVFASSDNLHARMAPLFLRPDQTFVDGAALKADLNKLDQYYASLSEDIKSQGVFKFATYPPTDRSFLVTQLWDKHLPVWRTHRAEPKPPLDKEAQDRVLAEITRLKEEATPLDPRTPINTDDADHVIIERKVFPRKGKWKRFPPEVEQKSKD